MLQQPGQSPCNGLQQRADHGSLEQRIAEPAESKGLSQVDGTPIPESQEGAPVEAGNGASASDHDTEPPASGGATMADDDTDEGEDE